MAGRGDALPVGAQPGQPPLEVVLAGGRLLDEVGDAGLVASGTDRHRGGAGTQKEGHVSRPTTYAYSGVDAVEFVHVEPKMTCLPSRDGAANGVAS